MSTPDAVERPAHLRALPFLAYEYVIERVEPALAQHVVKVAADHAYEYALAKGFALDGFVALGWLVTIVELGDGEPA